MSCMYTVRYDHREDDDVMHVLWVCANFYTVGWGEGLRVEQRGPVRGVKKPSVKVF
jgi:hypothetical protein